MIRRVSLISTLSLLALAASCDSGGAGAVGAPCNTADDCEGDLICDEHNGQASCQVPHGHGGDTEDAEGESHDSEESDSHDHDHSESEGDTEHGDTEEHETEHGDTEGHETEHGDTEGHDTEHGDTEGHDTEHGDTEGHDTDATTGGDALCEAFCGCMAENCASFDGYPYADEAACLSECASLDEATLACYGSFCEQASASSPDLAAHQCEHAWGELGNDKC